MEVCSSKPDAAFTSSEPTELFMYDHSKTLWGRELFFRGLCKMVHVGLNFHDFQKQKLRTVHNLLQCIFLKI